MKKSYFLLLFVGLIFTTASFAQKDSRQAKVDSLLNSLSKAKEDSNKVDLFFTLSTTFRRLDFDKSIDFGTQGLQLAQKLNDRNRISQAYYLLGNTNLFAANYSSALRFLNEALKLEQEKGDVEGIATVYTNIGNAYLPLSNYPKALESFLNALTLFEKNGNKNGQANCLNNISNVYYTQSDFLKALDYSKRALIIYKAIDKRNGIALIVGNIGDIHAQLGQLDKALPYFLESLKQYTELGDSTGIERNLANLSSLYLRKGDYSKASDYIFSALTISKLNNYEYEKGLGFIAAGEIYLGIAKDSSSNPTIPFNLTSAKALETAKKYIDSAIVLVDQVGDLESLSNAYNHLSEILHLRGDYKNAYAAQQKFKQLNDSVFNIERDKKITQSAMQYDFDKKEAAAKAEQEKRDIRNRNIRNSILAGLIGTMVFLVVVYRQRNKIKAGKKLSDELLLNILPEEVAEELKAKGSAEAKLIDEVTVLFTDFKGFTTMSEKLSPKELVKDIHECFSAFDKIIEKHGIEKIKTIGDAYMAAGGIPTPNTTHAQDVVNAALEIRQFIEEGKALKIAKGLPYFEIRIGVHTGSVVAGIVGLKKFAYDIWGDTVNTASRMESSGEVGKVNISGTTYALVKDMFNCTHRGKIAAKNKGEIDMYFVA
ncbi:MAG: tetratricopeptide repeat protein [Bacteroidetes bacterium]|nr:tetratricopeptide repeat protein [Bacteroidota bacterium]